MPIIVPDSQRHDPFFERLIGVGAVLVGEQAAESQDIRPARIGILNLMPRGAMERTEAQWLGYISHTLLQIEPVLIKFDGDDRERPEASRRSILGRYTPFSQVAEAGLDGLIITGDNLEVRRSPDFGVVTPIELSEIRYGENLKAIIDWSRENVFSTIYSCLGSHFALNHLYDIPREIAPQKIFGVYDHAVDTSSIFTAGMDEVMSAPHSRWGNVRPEYIGAAALKVLAISEQVGWLLIEGNNEAGGRDLFVQGHPEYGRLDLHEEYVRDAASGQRVPTGYYHGDDPEQPVRLSWANDAKALHLNWIYHIYNNFSYSNPS